MSLAIAPKSWAIADASECVDSMQLFLLEHPEFRIAPLEWAFSDAGLVQVNVRYLHEDTSRLIGQLSLALGAKVRELSFPASDTGEPIRSLHIDSTVAGVRWAVTGWLREYVRNFQAVA